MEVEYRGPVEAELVLSDEERLTLERLMNRRKSGQAVAMRAGGGTLEDKPADATHWSARSMAEAMG